MAEDASRGTIDFYTFVLSLGSSAFVHLGDTPHLDESGKPIEPDLLVAKQTIDILAMLRDKTKGNLTPEEEKFLDTLLTDLRIRFVQKSSKKSG